MATKVMLALFAFAGVCLGVLVRPPNSRYTVDYVLKNLTNNERVIDFAVNATNVTGWLGIGINVNRGNMQGANLFVAGVSNSTARYANESYAAGNARPTWRPPSGNWTLVSAAIETRNSTAYTVRLNLNRTNIPVQNKNIFLLWSYLETSDDISMRHTTRGNCTVNLVTNAVRC